MMDYFKLVSKKMIIHPMMINLQLIYKTKYKILNHKNYYLYLILILFFKNLNNVNKQIKIKNHNNYHKLFLFQMKKFY